MPPLVGELMIQRQRGAAPRPVLETVDPYRAGPFHAPSVRAERHRHHVDLRPRVRPVLVGEYLEVGGDVARGVVDVDGCGAGDSNGDVAGAGLAVVQIAADGKGQVTVVFSSDSRRSVVTPPLRTSYPVGTRT